MSKTKKIFPENLNSGHIGLVIKASTTVGVNSGDYGAHVSGEVVGTLEAIVSSSYGIRVLIAGTYYNVPKSTMVEVEDW